MQVQKLKAQVRQVDRQRKLAETRAERLETGALASRLLRETGVELGEREHEEWFDRLLPPGVATGCSSGSRT